MLNQIVLMGRLTKDPEVRKVGEKQVSKGRFTLAVDRRFARRDGDQQTADFIGFYTRCSMEKHGGICRP